MTKRLFITWLIVVGCAVGLRLFYIAEPDIVDFHSWRQSDTAAFTHRYLQDTLNPLEARIDRYPCELRGQVFGRVEAELPVAAWLAALPLKLVGIGCPSPIYLRIVSLLFFIGTCLYLFLLAQRLSQSAGLGMISIVVFSVLPLSLYFTRTVQPEGPGLFFSTAFLYHLMRDLETHRPVDAVLSASFGALACLQKISNAVLIFPAVYLIVLRHGWRDSLKRLRYWLWGIAILIPVGAWYLRAHRFPWTFGIWQGSKKFSTWQDIFSSKTWKVFSERVLFEILSWSGLILLILGFTQFQTSGMVRFGGVWLAAQIFFTLITIPANRTHIYYQLPLVLPASLIISVGTKQLWQQSRPGKALLAILVLLHAVQTVYPLFNSYYVPNLRLKEGIALIERHVPPESTLLCSDRNPALFTNACQRAYFIRKTTIEAIESCSGDDIQYLLLDTPRRYKLAQDAPAWSRLLQLYEEVEKTKHFSIWRRR